MALNHEEIKKDPQRVIKNKPFINKYNWEGINFPSAKDNSRKFQKIVVKIALMFCMLKKKLFIFQKRTQILKNKLFF